MTLSKQELLEHSELRYLLEPIYQKRLERSGLTRFEPFVNWNAKAYIDGPLTFVVLQNANGDIFTGWSKFNANDQNYAEVSGLCTAICRAVDKYLKAEEKWLAQSADNLKVLREAKQVSEVQVHQDAISSN